ncbi:required for meiotic nuclear division protein 1 homolog isoform X2 [Nematostella vectensis]|uniref:required for meiotic nuclear division protein 1 homolog isoform X2 n=1 Tax=Nematostella vectensis TaxID=45351 RepID=UPI00138FE22C|nr:required for meiotic nuclear division protein 1 homolog isoform X2 [Nematostella vectensis]
MRLQQPGVLEIRRVRENIPIISFRMLSVSIRNTSRFSSTNTRKSLPEPPMKIRPRIKSLSKEQPPAIEQDDLLCVAYSSSERYNILGLRDALSVQENYKVTSLPKDARDVLYVCIFNDEKTETTGEVFIFRWLGALVFWNVEQSEMQKIRKLTARFEEGRYNRDTIEDESEELPFTYSGSPTSLVKGRINLNSESEPETKPLEKFAFSHAVALSIKLGMWESVLEKYIDSIAWVPEALSKGEPLKLSRNEVLVKTGELISLRYKINLSSDLLMTPDFYWDRDSLEGLYDTMCSYMDIRRRTKVMNEKLTHCSELADLLRTHLSERHSFTLEWGIIALIAIEVLFEIVHLVETHL